MTATISTRPLSDSYHDGRRRGDSGDSLLRFGMRLDATLSALMGAIVVVAAEPLARLSGLSATTEWIIGASFVALSVAAYALAALPNVRLTGKALMVGNAAFAVLTVVIVTAGWLPLTTFGVMATLGTGLYTLAIGCFQYLGVRRLA